MKLRPLLLTLLAHTAVAASANPVFDRSSWVNWQGKWTGDFWTGGNFGTSEYMTCVGVDGSDGSPEFWAEGMGDQAARTAYETTLQWSNVADRNPVYIEVHCGY